MPERESTRIETASRGGEAIFIIERCEGDERRATRLGDARKDGMCGLIVAVGQVSPGEDDVRARRVQVAQVGERVDAILETDERDVVEQSPRVLISALNAQIGGSVMSIGEPASVNERGEAAGDLRIGTGIRVSDPEQSKDHDRKRKRKRSGARPAPLGAT